HAYRSSSSHERASTRPRNRMPLLPPRQPRRVSRSRDPHAHGTAPLDHLSGLAARGDCSRRTTQATRASIRYTTRGGKDSVLAGYRWDPLTGFRTPAAGRPSRRHHHEDTKNITKPRSYEDTKT